ncbi:MAG: carboxyl transferase domain-containing protein, partial [Bacteroidota bacterium]
MSDALDHAALYDDLDRRRAESRAGGGEARVARQHDKGKLTARERLDILLDPGSFVETGAFVRHQASGFGLEDSRPYGDGVVTGWGTIDGRTVYVFSQDFTVFGGSLGLAHAEKIVRLMRLALENGAPVIGLNDSGG